MIVMNGGVADQVGRPLDVYANPATEFVAGFIGSPPTNFLKADGFAVAVAHGETLGVRPEHIRLVDPEGARLAGRVVYSEPLGAETLVHLKSANDDAVTIRQDGTLAIPAEGETIGVQWEPEAEMLFAKDGTRIPS